MNMKKVLWNTLVQLFSNSYGRLVIISSFSSSIAFLSLFRYFIFTPTCGRPGSVLLLAPIRAVHFGAACFGAKRPSGSVGAGLSAQNGRGSGRRWRQSHFCRRDVEASVAPQNRFCAPSWCFPSIWRRWATCGWWVKIFNVKFSSCWFPNNYLNKICSWKPTDALCPMLDLN